jgi:hypothetical protein
MKIPETLKIGGHMYTVTMVDASDINDNCGEQNRSKNTIKIRKDMPQSQLEETLLHEAIHAINGGLKEETVDFLAMAIYALIKDNKIFNEDSGS